MADQNQILLRTKLHRPSLPHALIQRSRLLELLDQDIDHQLILVCAPAGYGKTTLIGTWLERMAAGQDAGVSSLPSAWLSLDENDSDLNLFLRYFIAALRTNFNQACEHTLGLLHAQQHIPQEVLNTIFSNDLEDLPGESILVLDDYHTIRGVEVHNLLNELTLHWPKPLHLVLISRISPPIPLDRLRATGMVSEIRTRDLRFNAEETAAYLSSSQYSLLSQNTLTLLEDRFEGWPAGLHLAALSLRSVSSQASVQMVLSGDNPNITGYLVDEVLAHQLPAIHSFLLKTSILDRFCASLCEAIIGEVDAAWNVRACLDWIERSELFIIPLDNHREWYRYHQLFQELLQQRLSTEMKADQVTTLHRLASVWFEKHELHDEALHHALAAGDLDLAVHQMNAGLQDVINREDRPTLERWLQLLPEEMIQRHPGMLMIKAWALQFIWRLDLQAHVIQQAEELLDSDWGVSLPVDDVQILRGQILLIRAQLAYFSNQTAQVNDLCQQVLSIFPPSWTFVRGGAMFYLGMSMQASGQALEAERLLLAEYESYSDKTDAYAMLVLESLGHTYLNTGQLEQTKQIAQLLHQGAARSRVAIMQNWGDWFLGVVCYQRNELEVAARHFTQIVENRYIAQITSYRDAVAGLTIIHQIRGESDQAWQMVESISQFDMEQSGSEDERTRSLRARLMVLQGDLEGAGRWADVFTDPLPDQPLMWLEEPQTTRVRILVARGAPNDLEQALQILDILDEIAERTHNTRYRIELLALRALALDAQENPSEARTALKQAIDLARPGGFIRVFVDLGKSMQTILRQLAEQGYSVETIRRILVAYPEADNNLVSRDRSAQPRLKSSLVITPLVEPLTPRELEVLILLREPLSIKEIAQKLNISYTTTKRHIANIYGKLGVNRRSEAVDKAEELNILPPR